MTVHDKATEFINGWVSGYLAHGGSPTDEGLAEKALKAYERRLHPLPAPVRIRLVDAAIDAAKKAEKAHA